MEEVKYIVKVIMDEFGGYGLFGVELFFVKDKVYFSEVFFCFYDMGFVILVM